MANKVLRADSSAGPAYVRFNFGSGQAPVCVSFRLFFHSAALTFWQTGPNQSGQFAAVADAPETTVQAGVLIEAAGWGGHGSGATPAPVAETWKDCQLNWDPDGDTEFKVGGVVAWTVPTVYGGTARFGYIGLYAVSPDLDPAAIAFIDDVRFGTTPGDDDLGADDFEDGTLDFWTSTHGDVSVVDDPTGGIQGINIASDDDWNTFAPTWERIDETYSVTGWSIDRGRVLEVEKTGAGRATIELIDRTGDFDPTNTGAAFYPLGPMFQAAIALRNPVTGEWSTLFRGFISRITWSPYITLGHANVTLELVDGLGVLAAAEMAPDGSFGDSVDNGDITFAADPATNAVRTRINNVLDQLGWASLLRSIFSGNVSLQESPFAPRSQALAVILEAADAEFPNVANFYMSKDGVATFHGREARFNPTDAQYEIEHWYVGDHAAVLSSPGVYVPASPPLEASLDDSLLYTSALATPMNIDDDDIAAQYVEDSAAVTAYGRRTWSVENLATGGGALSATALEVTALFADYVRDNLSTPKVRVGEVTILPRMPDHLSGPAVWALMCGVDISDIVTLTTTHHGGGGFADDFFVEGVHYRARPGNADIPIVEVRLDLTPRAAYDNNPFV